MLPVQCVRVASRTWSDASDVALVEACVDGNERAWEALVRRYGRLIHGIAVRADAGDPADLFQSVFLIVYRNLSLLEKPGALPAWIATIARREAWRATRHRRRLEAREGAPLDAPAAAAVEDGSLTDERLERIERAFLVQRGLEQLDVRCRRLLEILFWEEPAPRYGQIAARLGIPIGAIGPTRGRCLGRLRRALESLGW